MKKKTETQPEPEMLDEYDIRTGQSRPVVRPSGSTVPLVRPWSLPGHGRQGLLAGGDRKGVSLL